MGIVRYDGGSKCESNGIEWESAEDTVAVDSVEVETAQEAKTESVEGSREGNNSSQSYRSYDIDEHETDNMRGFDPASEDDMDDNGMSRYMDNDDDEGWDGIVYPLYGLTYEEPMVAVREAR